VTYVAVAFAIVAYAGVGFLRRKAGQEEFIFGRLSTEVLGSWDWVVLVSVATSAIASTQTTIIPASRTGLSMARRAALPSMFGRIHPRFRTPDVSTWWVAGIASAWYVVVNLISENALFDSLTALSLLIAFYYALTGFACAIFYRRHLLDSAKSLLLIGVGPVVGAVLLAWLLVESIRDISDPANSYSGQSWFGVGPPLVIAIGVFVTGVVLMFGWRVRDARYWQERPSTADPELVAGGSRWHRPRVRRVAGCRERVANRDRAGGAVWGAAGAGARGRTAGRRRGGVTRAPRGAGRARPLGARAGGRRCAQRRSGTGGRACACQGRSGLSRCGRAARRAGDRRRHLGRARSAVRSSAPRRTSCCTCRGARCSAYPPPTDPPPPSSGVFRGSTARFQPLIAPLNGLAHDAVPWRTTRTLLTASVRWSAMSGMSAR